MRVCLLVSSSLRDVSEPADRDDFGLANQSAGAISSDPEASRIVDVHLSGSRTVPKIMEIRVSHLQVESIASDKRADADVSRTEVDHDHFANQGFEQG
jgi:hypothetical protein